MDMMMPGDTSNVTTPSALHHKHQEAASPAREEEVVAARNGNQGEERKARPQGQHALKCPRCESTNTKFCYYNNYSMTQPRYFCKSCRRYWTQGGVLRNVPVGGACRKNKSSSKKQMNNNTPQLMMMPTPAATSNLLIPNVLPTLMSSTGGDSLPLGTTLFMDHVLRGNGSSSGMPFLPPPSFGLGVMQLHRHGVLMGGSTTSQQQQQQRVRPLLQGHAMPDAASTGGGAGTHQWAPTDGEAQQHQAVDGGLINSSNSFLI